jgi:hypothetical protein
MNEPEVIEATPDLVEPTSIEDTIREKYRELTAEAPETEETAEVEPEKPARVRGPDGKFAAAAVETAPVVEPKPYDTYPSSWKKDHEANWKGLPEQVRAEVHRREQDFLNGIKEYKEPAAFGKALAADLMPHLDTFRKLNTTPQAVVKEVMGTWSTLVNGSPDQKRQALLQVAANYGIELAAGAAPSPQNGAHPPANGIDFSPVLQRVASLEQTLQAQRAETERFEQERVDAEIAAFGNDPKHEHFASVKAEMGRLIQSGSAQTLQDAYDKAIWALPETRSKLLEKEAQALSKRQADEAAAARKAAAANVTRRGTPPAVQKPGSMEDTIRAEYRRLSAEG